MNKLSVVAIISTLTMWICPALADGPPNFYFDFNKDGKYDSTWSMDSASENKASVEIWLEDWKSGEFAGEPLFGVEMHFYYDDTKIHVLESNSFANSTSHGGPFDPAFCRLTDFGAGKIQMDVANFNCVPVSDKILLYTLELEFTGSDSTDIYIRTDYTGSADGGAVYVGGDSCSAPHPEDAGDATAQITTSQSSTTFFGKFVSFFKKLW